MHVKECLSYSTWQALGLKMVSTAVWCKLFQQTSNSSISCSWVEGGDTQSEIGQTTPSTLSPADLLGTFAGQIQLCFHLGMTTAALNQLVPLTLGTQTILSRFRHSLLSLHRFLVHWPSQEAVSPKEHVSVWETAKRWWVQHIKHKRLKKTGNLPLDFIFPISRKIWWT